MAAPDTHTDWNAVLGTALEQYRTLISAFTSAGETVVLICRDSSVTKKYFQDVDHGGVIYIEAPYNDTWTRDYGPICVETDTGVAAIDFCFNGWGLKFGADKDNLVNLFLRDSGIIPSDRYISRLGYVLEGGSIETDGKGTILTTSRCHLSPNRNGFSDKKEAEKFLSDCLGANRILWLDFGELEGDDTDSHIDTLARMAPNGTIVYVGPPDKSDPHFESFRQMKRQIESFKRPDGSPYRLIELPFAPECKDIDGDRLPATYANYLVTEKNLFMPIYNCHTPDSIALERIKTAFPDKNIVEVPCRGLLLQHGSLHCSTMQIPEGIFNLNKK